MLTTARVQKEVNTIEEYPPFKDLPTVTWFNVEGLNRTDIIEKMGRSFNLRARVRAKQINL